MTEPSTLQKAGGYQCHSIKPNHNGRHLTHDVKDGYVEASLAPAYRTKVLVVRRHETKWLDIPCGHITSSDDPGCEGCEYRSE